MERESIVLVIALIAAAGWLLWRLLRKRPGPAELERRRILHVNTHGRLAHGEIIEVEGASIVYTYSVGGVGYTAAQDVFAFETLLPANRMSAVGPALVKFDPRNPSNSMVLCETWSGLGQPRDSFV
jgi:hypothetical protein